VLNLVQYPIATASRRNKHRWLWSACVSHSSILFSFLECREVPPFVQICLLPPLLAIRTMYSITTKWGQIWLGNSLNTIRNSGSQLKVSAQSPV
jgi:hypothetical protein